MTCSLMVMNIRKSPPCRKILPAERASVFCFLIRYLIFVKKILLNLFQITLDLIQNLKFLCQTLNHCLIIFLPFFLLCIPLFIGFHNIYQKKNRQHSPDSLRYRSLHNCRLHNILSSFLSIITLRLV